MKYLLAMLGSPLDIPSEHFSAAHGIINSARYLTLATCSTWAEGGHPWAAALAFWASPAKKMAEEQEKEDDGGVHFFFASPQNTRHIQQIANSPQVAVSICDTSAPFGQGRGVQFSGKATIAANAQSNEEAWQDALAGICSRFPNDEPEVCIEKHCKMFQGLGYVIVRIEPEGGHMYVSSWKEAVGDIRTAVSLTNSEVKLRPFL